jgi:type VI secretion system secreted protein VgrG
MARFNVYDYPGKYYEPNDAERYARLRLEELQASHETTHASTTARGLAVGQVFELRKHPRDDQNRKYLITDLTLTADAGEFGSGGTGKEFLNCSFRAIPSTTPYRPARVTPKTVIQGIQTATVVGERGKEVDPDEFGRVKVQFHWDRYGKMDENSSCWVRVSQPWAGKGFGCMNIPRIGQEVVVEFIEGDPDRPLINGRLYHAENMPHSSNAGRKTAGPASLQAAAMMTSFKSNSLGGSGGYNEITMNDSGGKEGLFIKAQKDEVHNVGNDREDTVAHDETRKVANDRKKEVGNNQDEKIGNTKTIKVGGNHTETIGKNMALTVAMNKAETVGIASAETVGAAKALTVGAAYQVSVGGLMNETVGAAKMVEVALSSSETVGETSSLKAKKITLTADDEIAIKVGSAQMTMKKNGDITIKGNNITIKGTKIVQN